MAPPFPQFWTANIKVLSKNCYDHVKPIIQSTNLKIDSILAKFLRWSYRGTKWGEIWTRFQNSGKTSRYDWARFLGRTIALQNSPTRFPQSGAKFGGIENPPPLKPKVPVCLWLQLCTMISWGASLSAIIRGVTTGVKGHNSPDTESLWGRRKVLTMSQILQCSTFASEMPQVPTWGRQTCFVPRAPSNLVTTLTVIQYSSALSMYIKWRVAQLHS